MSTLQKFVSLVVHSILNAIILLVYIFASGQLLVKYLIQAIYNFYFLLKIYLRDKLYSFKKLLHSNVLNG